MVLIKQIPADEIAAYEVVRQRLRRLAIQHPGILEIPIADGDKECAICDKTTVVVQPERDVKTWEEVYTCRSCGSRWTAVQAASQTWRKHARKQYREGHAAATV